MTEPGPGPASRPDDRSRLVVGLTLAPLAAALLAACGAGQHAQGDAGVARSSVTAHPVASAARRTLSLTAAVAFRLDGANVFGATRAPVFGQGSFDLRAGAGEALIDLPEVARQELGNERAIIFPGRAYLQPKGASSSVLPKGKSWMSATLVGSESVSTNFPQFVGQVEGINPLLALSELAWGTTSARPLGEQLIDHAPAERYRAVVDLTRALSASTGSIAPAIGAAIQQQLAALPSRSSSTRAGTVSFEVWVDRAGRVVEYRAPFPGTGDGTALVELSAFGANVRITKPAAAEIVDITSLTPSGERENTGGGDSDGG